MASRSQLSIGSDAIIAIHTTIPSIGTNGTRGVRKGRGVSGLVLRSTIIPAQTNVKANKVPMLTMCPRSATGTKPEKILTKTINIRLVFQGVCLLDRSEKNLGNNPSLLMV